MLMKYNLDKKLGDWEADKERRLAEALASVTGLNNMKIALMLQIKELKDENRRLKAKLQTALRKKSLGYLCREMDAYEKDLFDRLAEISGLISKYEDRS